MNDQMERQRLEDVLDAFVASAADPESVSLAEWIRRYPQFEQELTEFAASWSLMRSMPPAPDAERADEETLVLRGMSVVQNLLHRQEQTIAATTPAFESLLAVGRTHGLAAGQLAEKVGLGLPTLRKLDRRLIRFASIPGNAVDRLVDRLATALEQSADAVAAYLQQGPTFAPGGAHRAEQAPQLAEQEDFVDAVRADPSMTAEQRAAWLALADRDAR